MLNKLNDDIILYILAYFNFDNCCQHSELINIKLINKNFINFIKNNKLIKNYKYYKLNYNFLNKNIICSKCNQYFIEDIKNLKNMCSSYQNFLNYKNNKNNKKSKFFDDIMALKREFTEYIHFNTALECTRFINNINNLSLNINFIQSCCDGKGVRFIFI